MGVSRHFCFGPPFLSQEERKHCDICVFLSPSSEFCHGHSKEQFKAAKASVWQSSIVPESPSTKVLFHCLKIICVCLKHTLCLWKGLSFHFGESDMFDNVNF